MLVLISIQMKGWIYDMMELMRASEVAKELSVSTSYAYKLIRQLNDELKEKKYLTIPGRISREYLYERLYGAEPKEVKRDARL